MIRDTETDYGLHDRGLIPVMRQEFFPFATALSRSTLGNTQRRVQRVKQSGREAGHAVGISDNTAWNGIAISE